MANSVNPNNLRIGNINDWSLKFIEKKSIEFKTYSFLNNELLYFFKCYFNYYGLLLVFFRLFLNVKALTLFLIYNLFEKTDLKNNQFLKYNNFYSNLNNCYKKLLSISSLKKIKIFYKNYFFIQFFNSVLVGFYKKINFNYKTCFIKEDFLNIVSNIRIKYKTKLLQNSINLFLSKLYIIMKYYFKQKLFLKIILKQLLKNSYFTKTLNKNLRKELLLKILKLRKFEKNNFFNLFLNLIFKTSNEKKTILFSIAKILNIKFSKINTLKNINLFINFFRNLIKYFLKNKINNLTIDIKGNILKKKESVKKSINFGSFLNFTKINNDLWFFDFSCFTKKGIFGIKIYIN